MHNRYFIVIFVAHQQDDKELHFINNLNRQQFERLLWLNLWLNRSKFRAKTDA